MNKKQIQEEKILIVLGSCYNHLVLCYKMHELAKKFHIMYKAKHIVKGKQRRKALQKESFAGKIVGVQRAEILTSRKTFLELLRTRSSNVFPTTIWTVVFSCNISISTIINKQLIDLLLLFPKTIQGFLQEIFIQHGTPYCPPCIVTW